MAILVTFFKNRTSDELISVYDSGGELIDLSHDNDKFRIKIGRPGDIPLLEISSDSPTDGGSSITDVNPATLRLSQNDSKNLPAGVLELEVAIVDSLDSGLIKHVESGVCTIVETMLGAVN